MRVSEILRKGLWVALAAMALVSLALGFKQASYKSVDFQWKGARLLAHHIDPWWTALHPNPNAPVDLSPPNYLHELYIFLLPLTPLDFRTASLVWCAINTLLSIVIILVVRNLYGLRNGTTLTLLLLFWMSLAFRNSLGVGQQSLVEMALIAFLYYGKNFAVRGIVLGLSYAKYSFSPVLVVMLAVQGKYRILLVSLVPPLLGFLITWYLLGGPPMRIAVEPLLVSHLQVSPGLGDLMTAIDRLLQKNIVELGLPISPVSYASAIVCGVAYGIRLGRRRFRSQVELALVALATLLIFRHLIYDYVLLLSRSRLP